MRSIRYSLLLLILTTACLATTKFPHLGRTDTQCNCKNAPEYLEAAKSDRHHVYTLSKDVLPLADHYMERLAQLVQTSCSETPHGDIFLQARNKGMSKAHDAHNLMKEIHSLSMGKSESEQFIHQNMKDAAQTMVHLASGKMDHAMACAQAKKHLEIHSAFIQHVENHKSLLDNRVKHIEGVLARCTSALQKGSDQSEDIANALGTNGNISDELKKRLGINGNDKDTSAASAAEAANTGDWNILGGEQIDEEEMAKRLDAQTLEQLGDMYNNQVGKVAGLKVDMDNWNKAGDRYKNEVDNSADGWTTLAKGRIEFHKRMSFLLQGRHDAELQRAICIRIIIKIKIKIQLLITLILGYKSSVSEAPTEQQALEALQQGYPLESQYAALLAQRQQVEQQMENAISLSLNFIIQIAALLREQPEAANIFTSAPEQLAAYEAAQEQTQGELANQQTLVNVVTSQLNAQIQVLVNIIIQLNAAGISVAPTQPTAEAIQAEALNPAGETSFDLTTLTSPSIQLALEMQIQLLVQLRQQLAQAQEGAPEAQQAGAEVSEVPQAQQEIANLQFQIAVLLRILLQLQIQIEITTGQAPQAGEEAIVPGENVLGGEELTPEQAMNVQLLALFRLQLQIEIQILVTLNKIEAAQANLISALQQQGQPTEAIEQQQAETQQNIANVQQIIIAIQLKIEVLVKLLLELNVPSLEQQVAEQQVNVINAIQENVAEAVTQANLELVNVDITLKIQGILSGQPAQINIVEALQQEVQQPESLQGVTEQALQQQLQQLAEAQAAEQQISEAGLAPTLQFFIQLVIQIRIQLEFALVNLAAAEQQGLPTEALEQQVSALENQFENVYQVVINLQILIQLQVKISQVQAEAQGQAPEALQAGAEALQGEEAPTQGPAFNLAVLLQLQIIIEIRLIAALSALRPEAISSIPAEAITSLPTGGVEAAPGAQIPAFNIALNIQLLLQIHINIAVALSQQLAELEAESQLAPSQVIPAAEAQVPEVTLAAAKPTLEALVPAAEQQAGEEVPSELQALFNFAINIAIQIQIRLTLALAAAQEAQGVENQIAPTEEIEALQAQAQAARELALNIQILIAINLKLEALAPSQAGQGAAPEAIQGEGVTSAEVPQNLLALLTLKLQIQIQIAISLQILAPGAITPSEVTPEAIQGQEAGQEAPVSFPNLINLIVSIRIQIWLQIQIIFNITGQAPSAIEQQAEAQAEALQQEVTPGAEQQVTQAFQEQLPTQEGVTPVTLLTIQLEIVLQLQIRLEMAQAALAQLQAAEQPSAEAIEQAEQNVQALQGQLANAFNIAVYLQIIININLKIQALTSAPTEQAPEQIVPEFFAQGEEAVPTSPAFNLAALIQLKIEIYIKLIVLFGNVPGAVTPTAPEQVVPGAELEGAPVSPAPGQANISLLINIVVVLQLQLAQAAANVPEAITSEAITEGEEVSVTIPQAAQNLLVTLLIQAKIEVNIALLSQAQAQSVPEQITPELQEQEVSPEQAALQNLFNINLVLAIQIKINLEIALTAVSQLQQAEQPSAEALQEAQQQAEQLEQQFETQLQILINIQILILINLRLEALAPGALAPVAPEAVTPEQVAQFREEQVPLAPGQQLTFVALLQVKLDILISLAALLAPQGLQVPEAITPGVTPEFITGGEEVAPTQGLPAAFTFVINLLVTVRLQFNIQFAGLQQAPSEVTAGQAGEAITPEEQVSQEAGAITPTVTAQAQIQVNIALLSQAQQNVAEQVPQAEAIQGAEAAEQAPEVSALAQLFNVNLVVTVNLRLRLELALLTVAQLQQAEQPSAEALQEAQEQAEQLQQQFDTQLQILINIQILILINLRLEALAPGALAPVTPEAITSEQVAQAGEEQAPLAPGQQVTLVALLQIKINILIELALLLAPQGLQAPEAITPGVIPEFITGGEEVAPTQGLPAAFTLVINILVAIRLQFNVEFAGLQQAPSEVTAGQAAEAITTEEAQALVDQQVSEITPTVTAQAQIQVNIALVSQAQQAAAEAVESSAEAQEQNILPSLFNVNLAIAINLRLRLELALLAVSQLQQAEQPSAEAIAEAQQQAEELEGQFNAQVSLLINIKILILINIRIEQLLSAPGQEAVNPVTAEQLVPGQEAQAPLAPAQQLTLTALIQIKINILIQIALAFAPEQITIPEAITPEQVTSEQAAPAPTAFQVTEEVTGEVPVTNPFTLVVNLLVTFRFQFNLEQAQLEQVTPEAQLEEQPVTQQVQQQAAALQPTLQIRAALQVKVTLAQQALQEVPQPEAITAEAAEQAPTAEQQILNNLFTVNLVIAVNLRLRLELAMLAVSQLQEAEQPSAEAIAEAQQQAEEAEQQFNAQVQILINIQILILINLRIEGLAPSGVTEGVTPEAITPGQEAQAAEVCPPGTTPTLVALTQLKLDVLINLALALAPSSIEVPEAAVDLTGAAGAEAGEEAADTTTTTTGGASAFDQVVGLIVAVRLELNVQLATIICAVPAAEQQQAEQEALEQAQQEGAPIGAQLAIEAKIQVNIALVLQAQQEVPQAGAEAIQGAEAAEQAPEVSALANLFNVNLAITVELRIKLEFALAAVAQQQQAEVPSAEALEAAQQEAQELQQQFDIQFNILLNIQLLILINLKLEALVPSAAVAPEAITPEQVIEFAEQEAPLAPAEQLTVTALIQIKLNILIELALAFAPQQIQVPEAITPEAVVSEVAGEEVAPTAPSAFNIIVNILVVVRLQFNVEMAQLQQQAPEAITPEQVEAQVEQQAQELKVTLNIQANIQVNIALAQQAQQEVPQAGAEAIQGAEAAEQAPEVSALANLFNVNLAIAIEIKIRLELALLAVSQLQEAEQPSAEAIAEAQQQAEQLQGQFDTQVNLLINIQIVILINLRIEALVPSGVVPSQEVTPEAIVSGEAQQAELSPAQQLTLAALIQIKLEIMLQIALALAPQQIQVPEAISPEAVVSEVAGEEAVPTAPSFNVVITLLVVIRFEFNIALGQLQQQVPSEAQQAEAQVQEQAAQLAPSFNVQAAINVNIALVFQAQQAAQQAAEAAPQPEAIEGAEAGAAPTVTSAIPSMFNLQLALVVELSIQLEIALVNLAQLQEAQVPSAEAIAEAQQAAEEAQQQYNAAFSVALYLQILIQIELRIQALLPSGQEVTPEALVGEQAPGLPSAGAEQPTLVALIQLKINILIELALVLAPQQIQVPEAIVPGENIELGEGVPTSVTAPFTLVINILVLVQLQFNVQVANLVSQAPEAEAITQEEAEAQAQEQAAQLRVEIEVQANIALNAALLQAAQEQAPEAIQEAQQEEQQLQQLLQQFINLAVQLRIELNVQLILIANLQLQAAEAAPEEQQQLEQQVKEAIEGAEGVFNQFQAAQNIAINLNILITINLQISQLAPSAAGQGVAPEAITAGEGVTAGEGAAPSVQLAALIQLKIEILIQIAMLLNVPGAEGVTPAEAITAGEAITPELEAAVPGVQAFNLVINLVVILRIEFNIQFAALTSAPGAQPEAVQEQITAAQQPIQQEFQQPTQEVTQQIEQQAGQPAESQESAMVFTLKIRFAIQLIIAFQLNAAAAQLAEAPTAAPEAIEAAQQEAQAAQNLAESMRALIVIQINIELLISQLPSAGVSAPEAITPETIPAELVTGQAPSAQQLQLLFEINVKLSFLFNLRWVAHAQVANIAQEALESAESPQAAAQFQNVYLTFSVEVPALSSAQEAQEAATNLLAGQVGPSAEAIEGQATEEISSALRLCIDIDVIIEFEIQAKIQYKSQGIESGEGEVIGSQTDITGGTTETTYHKGSFLATRKH